MIVGGQTEARASTIMDYHGPFDQGFTVPCIIFIDLGLVSISYDEYSKQLISIEEIKI